MTPEARLERVGHTIPTDPCTPAFEYEPYKIHNGIFYLASQFAKEHDEVRNRGRVGAEIDETEAARQMKICALSAIAWLKRATGGELSDVDEILHLNVYVACTSDVDGAALSRLADVASKVLIEAFGDDGRHPRSAVGVMRLPINAPVMIDLRAALKS